jgi:hypothetical protein
MIEEIITTLIHTATPERTYGLANPGDIYTVEKFLPEHRITDVLMKRGQFLNYKQVVTHTVNDTSYEAGWREMKKKGINPHYENFLIALWIPDPDLRISEIFKLIEREHIVIAVY